MGVWVELSVGVYVCVHVCKCVYEGESSEMRGDGKREEGGGERIRGKGKNGTR